MRISLLASAFSLLLLAGCGIKTVDGSGNVIVEERDVSGFSAISLSGSGEMIIHQTGKESLSITADDNLLPLLNSEVNGDELVLDAEANINPTKPIIYRLEVGKLTGIELSGSGTVRAEGLVTPSLTIEGSGSTAVHISGQADTQEISISGSGDYQAENLRSKEVTITITGSGNVVVAASDRLDVTITGSGSIDYVGDPVVTKSVTGSGTVRKKN
jgi:hypothetical protein